MVGVTWNAAETYCEWTDGRLPTEAEWEYAAKGVERFVYPWGDEFDPSLINYCDVNCDRDWANTFVDDGFEYAAPVGYFSPGSDSWVGASDMAGNVWEWVADWVGEYTQESKTNPSGPSSGDNKVIRGGGWDGSSYTVRTTYRNALEPDSSLINTGFRCAWDNENGEGVGESIINEGDTTEVGLVQESSVSMPPINAELGDTWTRPKDGMTMAYVPPGIFLMGSDPVLDVDARANELPSSQVEINAFWIDIYEVTNKQYNICVLYRACERSNLYNSPTFGSEELPVVGVTWTDAQQYCEWAGGTLPTEAQWEYAAKGSMNYIYPWGNEFVGEITNTCDFTCAEDWKSGNWNDTYMYTAPVGNYAPHDASWIGALDMGGNVREYVLDWYSNFPEDIPPNFSGPLDGHTKVVKGASWASSSSNARIATRSNTLITSSSAYVGFRCAIAVNFANVSDD